MKRKNAQSTSRQIKRGNSVMYFNNVTKDVQIETKKNTTKSAYSDCLKNRFPLSEDEFIKNVSKPIRR